MKPTYQQILQYAHRAVQREYDQPIHGFGGYDTQAVEVDVLNHFDDLTVEDDEESIIQAVHEAEQAFNRKHGVEL